MSDDRAAQLLRRLMDDLFSDWRRVSPAAMTVPEQEARQLLLERDAAQDIQLKARA